MDKNLIFALGVVLIVLAGLYFFLKKPQSSSPTLPQDSAAAPDLLGGVSRVTTEVLAPGSGEGILNGQRAIVHYTGWLRDGTKFDSSIDRGQPFSFVLGAGSVISGWEQGVLGMRVGEKRRLTIPPELGYGASGASGAIPPNATLTFEVELVGIE